MAVIGLIALIFLPYTKAVEAQLSAFSAARGKGAETKEEELAVEAGEAL